MRQSRLQAADDIDSTDMPLFERPQVDLDAPAVNRCIGPINTDEGRQALDCEILQYHLDEDLLAFRHSSEGYDLWDLGNTQDNTSILHREEALGYNNIEPYRGHEHSHDDHERGDPITQYPAQRQTVECD